MKVQAGIRLHSLVALLRSAGMRLQNHGSILEQSIAGALATGTHGTGIRLGSLAAGVVHIQAVLANGTVIDVTEESDAELLSAFKCHLGVLVSLFRIT